jgi:nucleoid-associated protein YgaU
MRASLLDPYPLILLLLAGTAWGNDYYLYSPAPASKEQASSKEKETVAVTEITVAKGDSLFKISRRFSGKGTYYPQILLFNDIKNPNLIYTGQSLRVPLNQGASIPRQSMSPPEPAGTPPVAEQKAPPSEEAAPAVTPLPAASPAPAAKPVKPEKPAVPPAAETEENLFAKGVMAYKSGRCKEAVAHFDQFFARHPDSLMTADASLYRADCYLQLAAE